VQAGHDGVLSVGRVQTPSLRLVVDRDRAIAAFVAQPYWDVLVTLAHANGRFQARWVPPVPVADSEGRCISEASARQVAQRVSGGAARVSGVETTRVRQAPPLPLDLGTLQQEASRRWGMGAQATLQAAQSLYETHKATTYPRTDCPYLPQSMRADVPQVLDALAQSDPDLVPWVQRADAERSVACLERREDHGAPRDHSDECAVPDRAHERDRTAHLRPGAAPVSGPVLPAA
jgi:DNA topoisomerase III